MILFSPRRFGNRYEALHAEDLQYREVQKFLREKEGSESFSSASMSPLGSSSDIASPGVDGITHVPPWGSMAAEENEEGKKSQAEFSVQAAKTGVLRRSQVSCRAT